MICVRFMCLFHLNACNAYNVNLNNGNVNNNNRNNNNYALCRVGFFDKNF